MVVFVSQLPRIKNYVLRRESNDIFKENPKTLFQNINYTEISLSANYDNWLLKMTNNRLFINFDSYINFYTIFVHPTVIKYTKFLVKLKRQK